MEVGLWILYLAVAFVLAVGVVALVNDRRARRRERHAH